MSETTSPTKTPLRALALIFLVILVMVLSKLFGLGDKLVFARNWILSFGSAAPFAFIGLYILATVLALPGSAITVGAGALFGSLLGVVYVSIASTIGASVAFLIARYLARDAVSKWAESNPNFQYLDKLTQSRGGIIVAFTRLIPIFPFNLLNYGFGLTRVRFSTYVLCSWLCMLPGTVLYVVGGDVVYDALVNGKVSWILISIAFGIIILLFFISRKFRGQLEPN